ncbi:ribonuclease H-like domain-containing protein [Tanacetum coccineum]
MSQPANDDFSQHLSDGEESNHEDASDTGTAPKQQQQVIPQTTAISNIKLPILKKEEYDIWAMEMEHYLEYIDNEVWKVIQNGNSKKRISTGKDGVVRVLSPVTAAEIQAVEKERKAKNILLMAIPKEHMRRFHGMDDAKEIWEAIRTRFGGNANSKIILSINGYMEAHDAEVSTEDANHNFVRSLPPAWSNLAMTMRTKPDVDTLSINDLYNNLRVFEQELTSTSKSSASAQNVAFVSHSKSSTNKVKSGHTGAYSTYTPSTSSNNIPEREVPAGFADEVIYSLFVKQSEDLDLLHEDLEQIDDMDIEEMDINWQIAMIAIRMKKFYKKTRRRVRIDGNKPVGFDKKKLECFKCHNTGHFARECTSKGTNDGKKRDSFYQDQGAGKKEQNQNCLLTMDDGANELYEKDEKLKKYRRIGMKAVKEKEQLLKIVDSWKNSSKNLWKLVDSGMSSTSKVGLGYEIKSNDEEEMNRTEIDESLYVRPNVNTGRANINSVRQNVNSARSNVNTGSFNINTVKAKQPIHTSNSNSFSPVRPQGNWGTAVKTSAGYNWRKTRPNSNCNSGSNFIRTDHPLKNMEDRGIFDSGCSRHMTGNKDHLDDFEEYKGGSVTFGGSKCYITGYDHGIIFGSHKNFLHIWYSWVYLLLVIYNRVGLCAWYLCQMESRYFVITAGIKVITTGQYMCAKNGRNLQEEGLDEMVRNMMKDKSKVFKTPTQGKTSREEDISPTTLEAAKTLSNVASQRSKSVDKGKRYKRRNESKGKDIDTGFEDINTGFEDISIGFEDISTGFEDISTGFEEVNTGGLGVSTGSGPVSSARGQREGKAPMIVEETQAPKRTKEQIQQEEASLAEAIRLQTLEEEETAKQVHLDALLAKRLAEEEELGCHLEAKLEANAELTKSVLGKELPEEDFAKKMVELVNQRKKFFAEERAKARRSKRKTQSQLRNYMMNYLKNRGTWKLTQLKKLSFEEVKEEFDKLAKQVESFVPINIEATKAQLKRYGEELQTKISKKQRIDDKDVSDTEEKVGKVKEEEPVKRVGKRKKQKARKCISIDKSPQRDSETDKEESVEAMNPTPLDTKSNIVAKWKIFQQGERSIYQIIRANGADTVYMSFRAMLKDFTREDLIELYRLVMQKYGTNRPEDAYDRVLWSDLRTMFDPPLNEDAIWSLPL